MELHNACHYILKTEGCYTLTIGYDFGFVWSIDCCLTLEGSVTASVLHIHDEVCFLLKYHFTVEPYRMVLSLSPVLMANITAI